MSAVFYRLDFFTEENPAFLERPSRPIEDFRKAKQYAKKIYSDHALTFYCACHYDHQGIVSLQTCGYKPGKDIKRAKRLEWEHIVPASHLSANRPCAEKKLCCNKQGYCFKGRECCRKIDPAFSRMEADLHNLVPESGDLNSLRSNYRFGMLPHIPQGELGACKIKIDKNSRRVEPSPNIRGMIARAYLYMSKTYQLSLSHQQRQLFNAWNREFPPTHWELEWDRRISRIQGNHNPYILHYEEMKKDG